MKAFKSELSRLTEADLREHPIWEFGNYSGNSECELAPVLDIPCTEMTGRRVGTQFCLADGSKCWGVLGGVRPNYPEYAEFLLSISLTRDGKWFHLSKPHQFNYKQFGPNELAAFLNKPIADVFPIAYDISEHVIGKPDALRGHINAYPSRVVSLKEIFEMSVRAE